MATRTATGSVKSAQRALAILNLMTREARPFTFTEVAAALGYPRASLHGLLATLVAEQWLVRDGQSGRFSLGIRAWEAGQAYTRTFSLPQRAEPLMRAARDKLGETIQLAVLDGFEAVYVAKVEGPRLLRLDSEVGTRMPAHATGVGKMLLASLDPGTLDTVLSGAELKRFTQSTITDRDALRRELEAVRNRGCAFDNEERTAGARCVAVPIRDYTGTVVAAMSVSVPKSEFNSELRRRATAELVATAAALESELGLNCSQV